MKAEKALATCRRLRGQPLWRLLASSHGPTVLGLLQTHLYEAERSLPASIFHERIGRGEEGVQRAATSLPLLTASEASVYAGLKSNIWAQRVRLEQERIGWERAICSVSAAMSAMYTQSPQAPMVCLNQKFDQTPHRPASPEGH